MTTELLFELLYQNITDECKIKLEILKTKGPFRNQKTPIFERASSSTNKYHKRKDGSIQTNGEHTFEMLHAAIKIMTLFNVKPKTKESNTILLAIFLHDIFKYGENADTKHTLRDHDNRAANFIYDLKDEIFTSDIVYLDKMIDAVKFHSGRWSSNFNVEKNGINSLTSLSLFVHVLDMLSTYQCLVGWPETVISVPEPQINPVDVPY